MNRNKIKIGINGFGRIGRIAARIISDRPNLALVGVNSRADISSHAYLLKYDSTYGTFHKNIKAENDFLIVNGASIRVFSKDEPKEIPWNKVGADIVIDATGKFRTRDALQGHITAGARKVVLSAPAKDDTRTFVLGVNHKYYNPSSDTIISNSSCTTNCLATTVKVLHDTFKIKRGFMTTTHSVTDSQNLLDNSNKKEVRLARSAFQSMIPSSTGSEKDIGKLFPELLGKIICQAIRVPLPTVSMITLTVEVEKDTSKEKVNEAYVKAANGDLKNILEVSSQELVSKDYVGNPHSSIVDTFLTQVVGQTLVNVYAWYDNEWGYTSRLVDVVEYVGNSLS